MAKLATQQMAKLATHLMAKLATQQVEEQMVQQTSRTVLPLLPARLAAPLAAMGGGCPASTLPSPLLDAGMFRLQEIADAEDRFEEERACRAGLYRKYHRAVNAIE
ncbi:MAG: hypothetical protein AB2556_23465 [Candidatus Thiodiazotropha sp.]